jgi:hypothetical protein
MELPWCVLLLALLSVPASSAVATLAVTAPHPAPVRAPVPAAAPAPVNAPRPSQDAEGNTPCILPHLLSLFILDLFFFLANDANAAAV